MLFAVRSNMSVELLFDGRRMGGVGASFELWDEPTSRGVTVYLEAVVRWTRWLPRLMVEGTSMLTVEVDG
jgi:hypothetical protein